ncbi:hypothetical protein [Actinoplanes sp. URMC 104]|uniref:hypothetical protein n=1 Tax=Actinoplanes sp. URMC 104 TaxID=3423409 RepID=UPI003F193A53
MDGTARPPHSDDPQPAGDDAATGGYDTGTYAGAGEKTATVTFPRIADYWPDATKPGATTPEPPRRRLGLLAGVTGAVVLLAVGAVALTRLSADDDEAAPAPIGASAPDIVVGGSPSPPVSVAPAPPSAATTATPPPTRSSPPPPPGPAFAAGTFVLADGVTELDVSLGRPPGNGIARVGSPSGSGIVPDARLEGTELQLTAERRGDRGSGEVDVVLDERITWTIRMEGGVRRGRFDMAAGSVRDLYFEGGAHTLDLTLPRQERQIGIRMAGGVHEWRIGTEGEFPVKVRVRKGAGEISLNGDRDRRVDRGETVRSRGRDEKSGGLRIEAVAGIGSLSVSPL